MKLSKKISNNGLPTSKVAEAWAQKSSSFKLCAGAGL